MFRRRRIRIVIEPSKSEPGQGLVEYALILSLVALVCILVLTVVGKTVSNTFGEITCTLGGDGGASCVCVNEQVVITGSCLGTTFAGTITSDCDETVGYAINDGGGSALKGQSFTWPGSSYCMGSYPQIYGYSYRDDGSAKDFAVTPQ
ncbi:MAG: hypothetical protein WAM60_21330 [Candidatus Promineifilaceae bacterium]